MPIPGLMWEFLGKRWSFCCGCSAGRMYTWDCRGHFARIWGCLLRKKPTQRMPEARDGQRQFLIILWAPGSIHACRSPVWVEFPSSATRQVLANSGSHVCSWHLGPSQPLLLWFTRRAEICLNSIHTLTSSSFHRHLSKWIPSRGGWREKGRKSLS